MPITTASTPSVLDPPTRFLIDGRARNASIVWALQPVVDGSIPEVHVDVRYNKSRREMSIQMSTAVREGNCVRHTFSFRGDAQWSDRRATIDRVSVRCYNRAAFESYAEEALNIVRLNADSWVSFFDTDETAG
jgi:hypothetical protein